MINNMRSRLKSGEIIHARVSESGKEFSIKARCFGGLVGYDIILPDGSYAPGYGRGRMLDHQTVDFWAEELEERMMN